MHRTLLLASPSVASREDTIKNLFMIHGRSSTDLQMLDRTNDGLVTLPVEIYDLVVIVKDQPDAPCLLTRHVFATLVPAMKVGCKLQVHDGIPLDECETREAVLSGLIKAEDGWFEKTATQEVVPLKLGMKKDPSKVVVVEKVNLELYMTDSDLIDEDELLMEEDFIRPNQTDLQQPKDCKKRTRACRDCTCGLAERFAAEDKARQTKAEQSLNIIRLDMNDLNELDYTTIGRTGSCGNCSLGDAFRCSGCPFLGFPAFKPGEEVRLPNEEVQQL